MEEQRMELTIGEVQQKNIKVLGAVHEICERRNIPYLGFFGTMLGAVRHDGPIPWDIDVDIAVPLNRYEDFLCAMESDLPDDLCLDYRAPGQMKRTLARVGLKGRSTATVHVDVFPIIGLPEDPKERKSHCLKIHNTMEFRCTKIYKYTDTKKKIISFFSKYFLFFITSDMLLKRFNKLCAKYPYETAPYLGCGLTKKVHRRPFDRELIEDTMLHKFGDIEIRIPKNYDKILTMIYGDYMKFPPEEERNKFMNRTYVIYEKKN